MPVPFAVNFDPYAELSEGFLAVTPTQVTINGVALVTGWLSNAPNGIWSRCYDPITTTWDGCADAPVTDWDECSADPVTTWVTCED